MLAVMKSGPKNGWLVEMDFVQHLNVIQLANALAFSSLLTILASGLALIFGLRDVMNFCHGALYMLGAYLGYSIAAKFNFWIALAVVPVLLAIVGVAFEYAVLRPLQKRSHMDVALITFGLALALSQLVSGFWGTSPLSVSMPPSLAGSIDLLGQPYPSYRIFLIAVGFGTCIALAIWL